MIERERERVAVTVRQGDDNDSSHASDRSRWQAWLADNALTRPEGQCL